ncbi:SRPBCC domain-containing protein [Chitinophaga sp. Cy-1792]|uniref:SRPBCC family protein n=1 Tax=Chitinophaga sp. Cy-1792 TaxID=2608339 RepID=UPI00141E33FF|nr:SRPBCC domain-containing protein [Chitinophaga sp. Cy-1792]NIG55686.1 ATPase [Chitinophaga sp. Cy-1792]
MELKTKISAAEGRQDLTITREFEIPVDLLYKAYTEADIITQWMGTAVLKLENRQHGSFQFETKDQHGTPVFRANGVIHALTENEKIVRTFEMENAPFGPTLEFLRFESTGNDTSKLTMHVIYETADLRDQNLKMPFSQGINYAHNRLESILSKVK